MPGVSHHIRKDGHGMSIQIPESVRKITKKCPHDFACLSTGQGKCKVHYADGKNVLFLTSKEKISCPYQIFFGYNLMCRCPTHFYIHRPEKRHVLIR